MELKGKTVEYLETGSGEMRSDVFVYTMHIFRFVIFGVVDVHLSRKRLVACRLFLYGGEC